jgi:hypothetical protein
MPDSFFQSLAPGICSTSGGSISCQPTEPGRRAAQWAAPARRVAARALSHVPTYSPVDRGRPIELFIMNGHSVPPSNWTAQSLPSTVAGVESGGR